MTARVGWFRSWVPTCRRHIHIPMSIVKRPTRCAGTSQRFKRSACPAKRSVFHEGRVNTRRWAEVGEDRKGIKQFKRGGYFRLDFEVGHPLLILAKHTRRNMKGGLALGIVGCGHWSPYLAWHLGIEDSAVLPGSGDKSIEYGFLPSNVVSGSSFAPSLAGTSSRTSLAERHSPGVATHQPSWRQVWGELAAGVGQVGGWWQINIYIYISPYKAL